MKNSKGIFLVTAIMILGLCVSTICIQAAKPIVNVDPEEPAPKSTVTFTAELSDSDIVDVWLIYNECDDVCHSLVNVSMDPVSGSTYEKQVTLEYATATYVQYWFEVETNAGWVLYSEINKVDLSAGSSSGNGDSNGSPGFELIMVVLSIVAIMFIVKRKRDK